MADLRLKYNNENGVAVVKEYATIMDFMDNPFNVKVMPFTVIKAQFMESKFNKKEFNSVEELLEHCERITS